MKYELAIIGYRVDVDGKRILLEEDTMVESKNFEQLLSKISSMCEYRYTYLMLLCEFADYLEVDCASDNALAIPYIDIRITWNPTVGIESIM